MCLFLKKGDSKMPSAFKAGLTGGAAANNYNVVQWHLGTRMVRSTVVAAGSNSARTVLSRVTLNDVDKQDAFTLATS